MAARMRTLATAALAAALYVAPPARAADGFHPERNDLSICSGDKILPEPDAVADVKQFAEALRGTWVLRRRSIQGVAIDTDSKYYFDLGDADEKAAKGWSMMIDLGNLTSLDPLHRCPACLADATVGALWKVSISSEGESVHLKMDGEYLGSYGDFRKGMTATEETRFYQYGPAFLAGHLRSPAGGQGLGDDNWDRISLVDGVFTYTSCKSGFIDRFVKISDTKPVLKGLELREAWHAIKESGALLNPPRGDYGK